MGRPRKYDAFLRILDDNRVYTPAAIAAVGILAGLAREKDKLKVRTAFGHFRKRYRFPNSGDGFIDQSGQPVRGWKGWRWKLALPENRERLKTEDLRIIHLAISHSEWIRLNRMTKGREQERNQLISQALKLVLSGQTDNE